MTAARVGRSDRLMQAAIQISPICLAAGLVLWLLQPDGRIAADLLRAGLFALMTIPLVRVIGTVARALRARDWIFFAATLAVIAEIAVSFVTAWRSRS